MHPRTKRARIATLWLTASLFALLVLAVLFPWSGGGESLPAPLRTTIPEIRAAREAGQSLPSGTRIVFEGYWNDPFEGLSVSATPDPPGSGHRSPFLLMRPGPKFTKDRKAVGFTWIASLFNPLQVERENLVRISGTYHAKGYGALGSLLEDAEWMEFDQLEVWDPARREWRKAVGWR